MGRLHQGRAQPAITFARAPAQAFAGALVIAGTHPSPRRQMLGGRKALHIGANLGQHHFCQATIDAHNRIEQAQQAFIRAQLLGNLSTQSGDGLIQIVDMRQMFLDEEPMVGLERPYQGVLSLLAFGP